MPLLAPRRRLDVLRAFYRSSVGALLAESFAPTPHALEQEGGILLINHNSLSCNCTNIVN